MQAPFVSPLGPQLKVWRMENGAVNSSAGQRGQQDNSASEKPWRLSLRIHAELALQKILIYDNDRLFRQFAPGSLESVDFTRVLTGLHDRQHRFVVEARDKQGRRIVSPALYTTDQRLQCTISSDQPTLSVSHLLDTLQGRESAASHVKFLFGSRDCLILQNDFTKLLNDGSPTRLADSSARYFYFMPRLHGPAFVLIERETVLKQTIEASDSSSPNLQMLSVGIDSDLFANVTFVQPSGKLIIAKPSVNKILIPDIVLRTGEFAALIADSPGSDSSNSLIRIQTAIGVYPLRSELQTIVGYWQPQPLHMSIRGTMLYVGYHLPIQVLPIGMRFRQTFLLLRPPDISSRSGQTAKYFEEIQRAFGLDGRQPVYTASMEAGKILSQLYPLDVTSDDDGAALVDLSKTDLPTDLPIRISKLCENWTAICAELPVNTKSVPFTPGELPYRALGVRNDIGYACTDLSSRAQRLFLGHPVICDRRDITINVMDWQRKGLTVELHNPGKVETTTQVRVHRLLGFGRQTVRIPAESSIILSLSWR